MANELSGLDLKSIALVPEEEALPGMTIGVIGERSTTEGDN